MAGSGSSNLEKEVAVDSRNDALEEFTFVAVLSPPENETMVHVRRKSKNLPKIDPNDISNINTYSVYLDKEESINDFSNKLEADLKKYGMGEIRALRYALAAGSYLPEFIQKAANNNINYNHFEIFTIYVSKLYNSSKDDNSKKNNSNSIDENLELGNTIGRDALNSLLQKNSGNKFIPKNGIYVTDLYIYAKKHYG